MKKLISIFLSITLVFGTFSFVYAKDNNIENIDDLIALANEVLISNDGLSGKTYRLTADINMNDRDWVDFIGTAHKPFKGIFDGNGHVIYNFKLRNTCVSDMTYGLFGVVGGNGAIKNLGVLNVLCYQGDKTIAYSHSAAAGLVAELTDNAVVDRCFAKNVTVDTKNQGVGTWSGFNGDQLSYAGGLVGKTTGGKVKITNSYSLGFVEADDSASTEGGLIGGVAEGSALLIENCYSDTSITSCKDADKSKFKNCYAVDTKSWSSFGTRPGQQYEDGGLSSTKLGKAFVDIDGKPALSWEKAFSGNGTKENPFVINDARELKMLSSQADTNGKYYKLANDIDLQGEVWTDFIGTEAHPFCCVFDGNGHIIKNYKLQVQKTGFGEYVGLFGCIGGTGLVKNLGVADISVGAKEWSYNSVVGGITGLLKDNGKIANSFVKNIRFLSGDYNVRAGGGLVGEMNGDGAVVLNCYGINCAKDKVNVVGSLSGLVGIATDFYQIENCYSDTTVTMVNHKDLLKIKNSFYLVSDDGTGYLRGGKLVKEIKVEELGEEFIAGDKYPVQKWEKGMMPVEVEPGVPNKNGEGDQRPAPPVINKIVEISTAEQLKEVSVSAMAGVEYKLTADIDLGGMDWNDYVIGKPSTPFKGIFDGNGFSISNFKINLPAGDYKEADGNELDLGLFGTLGGTGIIKNLGVLNVDFYTTAKSGYNARGGALVAKIVDYGTVDSCFARNVIYDTRSVGAFFGEAGGLIGYVNGKGVCIFNCYITGMEEKDDSIANDGGLIGQLKNFEKVENCYSTTTLSQCIKNNESKVINSYCLNNTNWSALGCRPGILATAQELKNVNLGDRYVVDSNGINYGHPILAYEAGKMPEDENKSPFVSQILTEGNMVKAVTVDNIEKPVKLAVAIYEDGWLTELKLINIVASGEYDVNIKITDKQDIKTIFIE